MIRGVHATVSAAAFVGVMAAVGSAHALGGFTVDECLASQPKTLGKAGRITVAGTLRERP